MCLYINQIQLNKIIITLENLNLVLHLFKLLAIKAKYFLVKIREFNSKMDDVMDHQKEYLEFLKHA